MAAAFSKTDLRRNCWLCLLACECRHQVCGRIVCPRTGTFVTVSFADSEAWLRSLLSSDKRRDESESEVKLRRWAHFEIALLHEKITRKLTLGTSKANPCGPCSATTTTSCSSDERDTVIAAAKPWSTGSHRVPRAILRAGTCPSAVKRARATALAGNHLTSA